MSEDVFLVDGVRTPQGRYGGMLASVRPDDLAGLAVAEVVARSGVPGEAIDEVILGAANQAGEDNRDVARMAVLLAGLPETVPGYTVDRLCTSGLTAVASAASAIRAGEADVRPGRRGGVNDAGAVGYGQARHPVGLARRRRATEPDGVRARSGDAESARAGRCGCPRPSSTPPPPTRCSTTSLRPSCSRAPTRKTA